VETHRVVRRRGCHIFWTIGSQMAVRFSALRTGRPLPPRRFLAFIIVRGWVDPWVILRLDGLRQLKKSNDLIGNRTCDLPASSVVSQPIRLPRAPQTRGKHSYFELNKNYIKSSPISNIYHRFSWQAAWSPWRSYWRWKVKGNVKGKVVLLLN
jgi:hypothetical protein